MKKFILSLMCFFFVVFSGISHAVTINTANINGKYYGLTGALNNPAVGVAVELGTAMLTKANPWITGIGLALSVYKIAEELFPGQVVAFRPGLVSESVPTWTNNLPPSTNPGTVSADGYDYSVSLSAPALPWEQSAEAAGADFVAWKCTTSGFVGYTCTVTSVTGTAPNKTVNWSAFKSPNTTNYSNVISYTRATVKVCPAGYTLSGGDCNLTSASTVKYPSDGISTYISDGAGHFVLDPRDPDLPASNLSGIAGQSSVTQKSADGKQSSTTTQNTDGSISHSTTNEYYDSTDASTHQFTQNFTINNAGSVTNYSSSNPVVQAVNGVVTPVSSSSNVVFPSDYARVGEAQTAANSTNAKLAILHDDLTTPGTPIGDPSVPDNGSYTDFGTTFSSLTNWSLPGHTSTCPTASFAVPWGPVFTVDSHCALIINHWAVLQTAMTVVWTISALFIVLRA